MKKSQFLNKTTNYREGQQIDIFWSDNLTPDGSRHSLIWLHLPLIIMAVFGSPHY